jgi:glucosyl-dolichyl phosphate glucuronosyltransferase
MKISAIICTYNREAYILDALTSLQDQSLDPSLYEIILVDNNSTDATPLLCMDFSRHTKQGIQFHYYKETQQGLSHARNRGIVLARGEYVAFLDDDAVACKAYLQEICDFFEHHSSVDAIGGRIFPKYEQEPPSWMPSYITPLFSILDLGEIDKPFSSGNYPVGANMAFRKEVFAKSGLFNTELGRTGKNMMGGEEKDLFYRIQKHSCAVWYAAKPWVYHIIPAQRMTKSFIYAQAIGVGVSERRRTYKTAAYIMSVCKELLKWGASFLLALQYLILAKPGKARMILLFRVWVSQGLFGIKQVN